MIGELALVLVIIIWTFDLWRIYLFKRQLHLASDSADMPQLFQGHYEPVTYMNIRIRYQTALSAAIFSAGIMLLIKTVALTTPYHKVLWSITADLSQGARPPAFAALDIIVTRIWLVPIVMLAAFATSSWRKGPSPIFILIEGVLNISFSALQTALFLYAVMFLVESFGVDIFMYLSLAIPIIGILLSTLIITVLTPLEMKSLQVLEVAGLLESLATRVGFNPDNIFVNSQDTEPNASYGGILWFSIIVVNRALVSVLNPGEVCAVFAHELGHWSYGLSTLEFLVFSVLTSVGFLFSSYGMSYDFALKLFSLPADKDRPHVSVAVYLGLCYILPVICGVLNGLHSCIGSRLEFKADDYAARLGYSGNLKTALMNLYARTGEYPMQDTWFSAWYNAHPSLTERLWRIDNKSVDDYVCVITFQTT